MKRTFLLSSAFSLVILSGTSCGGKSNSAPAGANAAQPVGATSAASAPAEMPVDRIDFRIPAVNDPFIKGFWNQPDPQSRWTMARHVEIRMACKEPAATELKFTAGVYLIADKLPKQRLFVSVNGKQLETFELTQAGMKDYVVKVPAGTWNGDNLIVLEFPDAQSPLALGLGNDARQMGFALQTLEIKKAA